MKEENLLLAARYVENDLDKNERSDFEQRLSDDEELQQALEHYHHVHQSLKMKLAGENQGLKNTLHTLNKEYFGAEPRVVKFRPALKWLSGIAAVLIVGLFIWAPWQKSLYDQYAGDGQMMVTERGDAKTTELDKAAALYNEKQYQAAGEILKKLYAKDSSVQQVAYYYGITLTETGDFEAARKVLQPVFEGESVFKFDAAYAIAMSYLKQDQKAEAKTWLQKIPKGTSHDEKAKELLEKL